jgi:hypothetical protein
VRVSTGLPFTNRGRNEAQADLAIAMLMKDAVRLLPTEMTIAVIRVSWPGTSTGPSNHSQITAAIYSPIVISLDTSMMRECMAWLRCGVVAIICSAFTQYKR